MYSGLLHLHSGIRYIVLTYLIVVLANSLIALQSRKTFGNLDNKISLGLLITVHTQFLVGFLLYFFSPNVRFFEHTMSNPNYRYWTVEHITANLLAVVLITLGRIRMKKATDAVAKHKILFWFTFTGTLILLISIWQSHRGIL